MPNPNESPMAVFVQNITLMGEQRRELAKLGEALGKPDAWRIALEDLALMTSDNMVVGLRTKWVRRVCVPVTYALRALKVDGNDLDRGTTCIEILGQLAGHDDELRVRCQGWVQRHYLTPSAPEPQNESA